MVIDINDVLRLQIAKCYYYHSMTIYCHGGHVGLRRNLDECFECQVSIDSQSMELCRPMGDCIKNCKERILNVNFLGMKTALVIFLKTSLGLGLYKCAFNHEMIE